MAEKIAGVLNIPYESFTSNQDFVSYYQDTLAPFLLNQVEVIINNVRHKLREIEFYFTSEQHDDPFTHCDKIQEQNALWYFHKMGSGYKGGSYKGLDITIGRGKEAAGGILIRSIESIEGAKKIVCGPSLCVDHVIDLCGADSIQNLVDQYFKDDISVLETNSHQLLYLKLQDEDPLPVYHTPRIGLHMTKKDVDPSIQRDYVFRCYRSISSPTEISKGKNLTICALYDSGKTLNEICDIMNSKMSVVTSSVEVFKNGYESKSWKEFVGTRPSDKEVCRAYGAVQKSLKKSNGSADEKNEEEEEKDENDNGNEKKEEEEEKPKKGKRNTRSKKMEVEEKSEDESEEESGVKSEKEYSAMLVAELKSECKKRGLPVSGTKAVLISRLLEK